jgi:TP901 family phage tail tape measure protein
MALTVGDVDIKVQLDKASLSSSLRSAKGDVDSWASDVESRTSKLGSSIAGLAKTGLLAAGAAAVGVTTAGLSSYRDLEEASSHAASKAVDVYGKSTEEIGAEYDKLLKHVQDVSADVGASTVFSDIEVAKTFDALAAGGIDISNVGRNQLLPFMNLASSTGEDLTDVTDLLTGSMASFGYSMEDSETIADQLAMAMNGSKASMSTLNYALRQGGSTASATGMELSEFSAIVGVMADRNYTGEQSGAALKTALLSLYTPTKVQREAMEKLGITYDQVDPRVHNFRDTLKLLIDKGADIGDFGQIFTDSSGAVMYALAEEGDAVDSLKEKIVGSKGLSQTMSDLMMDNQRLVGAWEEAKGATMGMVTAIGGYLEPAAVRLLGIWKDLIPSLREFGSALAEGDWSKVGEMLGNAWTVAKEKGMDFLDWAKTALQSIDWGTVATQAGGLIAGGIQTGLSALSGLGATVGGWIKDFDYAGAGRTISGWIQSGIDALVGIGTTIGGWIKDFDYAGAGTTIAGWLKTGFDTLSGIAATLAGWIKDFDYTGAGTTIAGWISTGIETLKDIGGTIGGWIEDHGGWKGVGEAVGEKVSDGIKAITTYAEGIADKLNTWLGANAKSIGESIGKKISEGIQSITTYVDGVKNNLQDWVNSGGAKSAGDSIGNAIADGIKSVMDLGKWVADSFTTKGGGNAVIGAIKTGVEWTTLGQSAVNDFVTGFISGLAPIGAEIYNTILDAITAALTIEVDFGEGPIGDALNNIFRVTGTDNAIADYIQSKKIETKWSAPSQFGTGKGGWAPSSPTTVTGTGGQTLPADITKEIGGSRYASGTLEAAWRSGKLMVSEEGIGTGGNWISMEDWAKKAGASGYSEEALLSELQKMQSSKIAIDGGTKAQIVEAFRAGALEAETITTSSATKNAATYDYVAEFYKRTHAEAMNNFVATNNWANNETRMTAAGLGTALVTGSSAILESTAASKVNFDLGSKSWVESVNQSNVLTSTATKSNVAAVDIATQFYASTHAAAMANFTATNLLANNETRAASAISRSNMVAGGSAILESAAATKVNFDLGSKNWINSTNQGGAIHLNAANQGAAVSINASNQKASIETAAATTSASTTTAAGQGLKANVDGAGEGFKSAVTAASDAASNALYQLPAVFSGLLGGGGYSSGGGGSVGTANFNDCLFEGGFVDGCTGVSIPGLKYTNPQGVTTIINPMNYNSGSGLSSSSSSSGGSSGYSLPTVFRARGGLIESPEVALIGEKGSEMVLPHDITQTILTLTNMGLGKAGGGSGDTTININLDGRQIAQAVMNRATGMMRQAGLGIR